jgi:hypothetical protein
VKNTFRVELEEGLLSKVMPEGDELGVKVGNS